MGRPVRRTTRWWAGTCLSAILAAAVAVAVRHALETPQPLKSQLPGEAFLYRWQRRSIFYKVLGSADAPPLVLLHTPGIGVSAREMRYLMPQLARNYRVYAPDLLGFGLSDRPGGQYSANLYGSLCQDFLRDVVKEPATLVASELSCNYAVSVAASAPDLCTALVLISPHALQGSSQPAFPVAEVPILKALLYPLLSTRLGFLLTQGRRRGKAIDFAEFYAQTHQLGAEHAVMALLAGKLVEDVSSRFQSLQQPILLVWGTQALEDQKAIDGLHKTAALSGPAHRTREVELIPQAGLAVQEEQPEKVADAIRRWQEEQITHASAPAPSLKEEADAEMKLPAEQKDSSPVEGAEKIGPVMAYCVKCKQKREMLDAHEVTMKNGRRAVRGRCSVCGTTLNRMGGIA